MTCPSCGGEVPVETGQHALTPSAGLVTCPHCGASATLDTPGAEPEDRAAGTSGDVERAEAAPPGRTEGRNEDALEETIEGVRDELADKEGGPA